MSSDSIDVVHFSDASCILCHETIASLDEAQLLDRSVRRIKVVQCPPLCLLCTQSPQARTWCHLSCLSILIWTLGDDNVPNHDDLLSYGTLTRPRWKERRLAIYNDGNSVEQCTSALRKMFSVKLVDRMPREIVLGIVKLLGPVCLSAIREFRSHISALRRKPLGAKISLDPSRVVYRTTFRFRGNSYISMISNQYDGRENLRKLRGRLRTDRCRVAVSFDEIGVRNIRIFGPGASTIPADGSPWYYITDSSSQVVFEGFTDGLILRDIRRKFVSNFYDSFLWDTTNPPTINIKNFFSASSTGASHSRFRFVPFNAEAYMLTVHCRSQKILGICAHDLVDLHPSCGICDIYVREKNVQRLCFPVNAREKIQGIWIRTPKLVSTKDRSIIVETTRSRVRTFGLYSRINHDGFEFHSLLGRTDGFVDGIYYNALEGRCDYVTELGVICSSANQSLAEVVTLPNLPAFYDSPTRSLDWYLSAAPLDNLRSLRFSYDEKSPSCTGVLLVYHDGSQDVLGQLFWDRLISSKDISRENTRYYNITMGKLHCVQWKEVDSDVEPLSDNSNGDNWRSIPETGTIRWWFGRLGNRIVIDPVSLT
ncbi:uncharacterized protein PV07_12651 [Cladophialophora immunda]|uniref:Uncharacterized protein n=1 Tax=Cladophialophora immunda TaxID=569365 RepID=A0A0D2CEH3_9EURO|nr:uncharacterized protein PV07_12651 [Cladophialophora immunda]KIW21939.1 hypothetical protein PV07_12651 [Cladophialophora immunda]